MKSNRGFSLLELLIVVAIILIIATIAIPSLLRSRQAAQESSAVAQVRTINTAEVTYLSSNQGSYGDVPSLITQGFLDSRFTASVSGYNFSRDGIGYGLHRYGDADIDQCRPIWILQFAGCRYSLSDGDERNLQSLLPDQRIWIACWLNQ